MEEEAPGSHSARRMIPHEPFSLFDSPSLPSFDSKFYYSESHHQQYLSLIIKCYSHPNLSGSTHPTYSTIAAQEALFYLHMMEKLDNPMAIPLIINNSSSSHNGNKTLSIDYQEYLAELRNVEIHESQSDYDEPKDFHLASHALRYGNDIIFRLMLRSGQGITESRIRGLTLLSFPSHPPRLQSIFNETPSISDEEGQEKDFQNQFADFICCICLEIMKDPVSLPCGHSGCRICLQKYLNISSLRSAHCPVCRVLIPSDHPLNVTVALRSAIQRLVPQITPQPQPTATLMLETRIGVQSELSEFGLSMRHEMEECFSQLEVLDSSQFNDSRLSDLFRKFTEYQSKSSIQKIKTANHLDLNQQHPSNLLFPHQLENNSQVLIPKSSMTLLLRKASIYAEDPDVVHYLSQKYYAFTRSIVEDLFWITLNNLEEKENDFTLFNSEDLLTILKPKKCLVYGYGGVKGINYVWTESICAVLTQIHPQLFLSPSGITVLHDAIADVFDTLLMTTLTHLSSNHTHRQTQYGTMDQDHRNILSIPLLKQSETSPGTSFSDYEVPVAVLGGSSATPPGSHIVTCSDIQKIVILVFREDVFSYCMKDIQNTLNYISHLNHIIPTDQESGYSHLSKYQTDSHLTFSIHITIYLAYKLYGIILTLPAACYLTMLVEYITAEALELAGFRAIETNNECVMASHVHYAIFNDSELIQSCPGAIKHHQKMPPFNSKVDDSSLRDYHILRDTLLSSSPHGIIIDPLTGCHISSSYRTCHHLDIACTIKSASQRAKIAYDLCSPAQQHIIDTYRHNTLRIRRDDVYTAQWYATIPVIPMESYVFIMSDLTYICQEKLLDILNPFAREEQQELPVWNIFWTMECLVLLQLSVERYFIKKLEKIPSILMKDPNWDDIVTIKVMKELFEEEEN